MSDTTPTIIRQKRRKRTYRWVIEDPSWPGHTSYIAVEGITVTMGDRFEAEGFEKTYSCLAQGFVDGCFHKSIRSAFGKDVLKEVLDAVKKRGWGLRTPLLPSRLSFEQDSDAPNPSRRAFTPPANSRKPVRIRRRARQAA